MALQSLEQPAYTPIVLAIVAVIEFAVQYMQLESELPAANATTLALTRVLVWWDGLSLIQQRMPAAKDRLVDVVESALVMQQQGFVQVAIANLGRDMDAMGGDIRAATGSVERNGDEREGSSHCAARGRS